MWLDDDGDEPESSSFPDPSTRQWRHPSEIAAENAKAAAAAAASVPDTTATLTTAPSSTSILWPITVVGGCIAVAALGVFGLYLTGASTGREVIASAATTIGPNGRTAEGGRAAGPNFEVRESESLGSKGTGLDGGAELAESDADAGATTTTAPPPSTTTSTTSTLVPAPDGDVTVGPALYATADLDPGHLAGVVAVDRFLLTSASAIAGHDKLSLRVSGAWIDADVTFVDLFSDVAIITPAVSVTSLQIPVVETGGTVNPGSRVYLGYCMTDVAPPAATVTVAGCSPSAENGGDEAEVPATPDSPAETDPDGGPATPEGTTPERGAPYGKNDGDDETGQGAGGLEDPEDLEQGETDKPWRSVPTVPSPLPAPDGEQNDGGKKTEPLKRDPRAGTVYSTSQALRTLANYIIYEPIRTEIPRQEGVAGSPLRDPDGQIVGLVVGASSPNVAALPIDRALAVALSFAEFGTASQAWLGFTGTSTGDGVVVNGVDELGPAAGILEVGDTLEAVQGEALTEVHHLIHETRQAGVNGVIELSVNRDGERSVAQLTVGRRAD